MPSANVAVVSKQRYGYSKSCLVYASHVIAACESSLQDEDEQLAANY
jgi:hypothetical protein